ncbi:splicing factor 3 subunit 1 [Trichinella spiralis]|uniref:splicing factor 3 subunit 1 n=1 Tax=Trichinella spiralis TaxID=6334 RepID=UPI0001EFCD96|nr:splicing factor 3 subunit 1 [Trichinella spiralis]
MLQVTGGLDTVNPVASNGAVPTENPDELDTSKSGKPIVGVIYPPPEIRNIVDKTASFVARNGFEFESRIRQHEINNPKFNFLNPGDPYHAYYQQKIRDIADGKCTEMQTTKPQAGPTTQSKLQEAIKLVDWIPRDPPPEFEFIADPTTINALDLVLIMFVNNMFVAFDVNFDFLKPQHSNFAYFTRLVEQYTKIILPPKDIVQKLENECRGMRPVLDLVKQRVDWEQYQRRIKEREDAEAERERLAYSMIDWHDFVVVQTVDFQPQETVGLPPPCTPKDVGARILAQQRMEANKVSAQSIEMEVDSDEEVPGQQFAGEGVENQPFPGGDQGAIAFSNEEGMGALHQQVPKPKAVHEVTQPQPAPPRPENVTVRKDYNPRSRLLEKVQSEQKWVISPLTGEKIQADKLTEHLKFNTVDQQYFVQKERELQERQEEELVFALGSDISANIKAFAERRSDIFGVGSKGAEQTMIGKKLGEEDIRKVDPKTIWDGHQASVETTSKAAQAKVNVEEQIAQIHRAQGLLPDSSKERIGPKVTAVDETTGARRPTEPTNIAVISAPPTSVAPSLLPPMVPVVAAPNPLYLLQQNPRVAAPIGGSAMYQHATAVGGYAIATPAAYPPEPEPPVKRTKTFEEQLKPEEEWLNKYGDLGPVNITVVFPLSAEKPEWNLNGQSVSYSLNLTDPVSAIKGKIQETTSMPASKQKLSFENIFIKDANTLAYYNMLDGSTVQLQLKERGGRKK